MSQIQIRIDEETKKSAKKVLEGMGIDMSTAVKVYLKQIIIHQGIPFKLVTENGLTPEEEKSILRASKEAATGKNVTKSMKAKEALDYLKRL
ncbi:type II toxin-antitoxin system RelB/DinJ family antitoxin [Candidatus Peregrinibacteria bacterium]|nr:type II toxin-antitoxin system RelB/DinJ family antitoxin [Candidatus Peregrinibacteria bacterium]